MSAQDTRTLLLETALQLIWSSNYNAVGVNEICKQAGVTKGSFYHHFESKAELFCEATNFHWEHIRQDLDRILSPATPPLEQLHNWIEFILANKIGLDQQNIPGCAFFNAGTQVGCCEAKVSAALQTMSERGARYYLALVRSLEAGDYLYPGFPAETSARLVQQYVQGAITQAQINRDICTIRRELPQGIYRLIGLKPEYWQIAMPACATATA